MGYGYMAFQETPDGIIKSDAVPVNRLIELRDKLYDSDSISMEGLKLFNDLIVKYSRNADVRLPLDSTTVYKIRVTSPNLRYGKKPLSHIIDSKSSLQHWINRSTVDSNVVLTVEQRSINASDLKLIGNTVFGTKEEAEAMLKMLRGNR